MAMIRTFPSIFRKIPPFLTITLSLIATAQGLSFTPAKLGWARLTARLVDAKGDALVTEETTLTIGSPDRTPQRAFRYGFCAHSDWLEPDQYKLSMQMLGASGIDILRDGYG